MKKTRFPTSVLRKRLERFQKELSSRNVNAAMIRVQSTFTYFTGTKWLRPALLIPAHDEPILFVARGEEEELAQRTWIDNIVTFRNGGDLMAKVSSIIRSSGYRTVGLEYSIERDAYIFFYEMFKRLNSEARIVDISNIVAKMRIVKDKYELETIRKAGKIAVKVMNKAIDVVKPGISETEIAAEACHHAYKLGVEEPKIYVNVGPNPRVHAEPFRDQKVVEGVAVTITLGIDYNHYYTNMSRTIIVGHNSKAEKAVKCMKEAYEKAAKLTKPGVKPINVIMELDRIYNKHGLIDYRVVGYLHGVGLQVEETPITTIVPKHRFIELKPEMVVTFIHAPIMLKGVG